MEEKKHTCKSGKCGLQRFAGYNPKIRVFKQVPPYVRINNICGKINEELKKRESERDDLRQQPLDDQVEFDRIHNEGFQAGLKFALEMIRETT